MSSEIKVDTISENTSANGVAIDSLGIKDGKITNLMNATLSAADLGTGLHIKSADSGLSSVAAGGDELIIEGSGDSGMHILSGASNDGNIFFGDSGDADNAYITYDHSTNHLHIGNGALTKSNAMLIFHGSSLCLGTNGETSPDTSRGGLCLNQGGTDANILTFKSSDVAHGQTETYYGGDETDTFATFEKNSATVGGLKVQGYSEGESAFVIDGRYTTDNTTKGTGATCPVQVNVRKISGTDTASPGANANMFSVTNNGQTKFIVDEDGDLHYDGSTSAYDSYEDAHLARALDLSHGVGVINSKFDKFVSYNHEKLADMKLVGREENGTPNHFINITGMQRLHNGAIWQQYEKHQKLAEAVYEMAKEALGEEKADAILEKHDIKLLS
jgi:hypothetical protein